MARTKKTTRFNRKMVLISAVAVVVVAIVAVWLFNDNPTSNKTINVAPTTSKASATDKAASSTAAPSNDKQTPPTGGYSSSSTPSGQFISNHMPGQNSPTTETSVCTTTPGASCYIKFTKGTLIRTLQTGTADSNGSVFWNGWDVYKDADLTPGVWQITAVASLNGQTATASDATPLTIQ